ncbi:MAG: methionine synthase, partial [Phycisphaeraceae bacterium]|nr:methionine synthase [Phycisphaeraceae bacterium]
EFDLQDQVEKINRDAVRLARAAARKYTTDDSPRFVLASIGPGTKLITLGNIDWDTMLGSYKAQAMALMADGPGEGADALLVETCQDVLQVKVVVNAIVDAQRELGIWETADQVPIFISITIEQTGQMLVGSDVAAALTSIAQLPVQSIGMNCATGPKEMTEHLVYLGQHTPTYLSVYPNAGLPTLVEGKTVFPMKPDSMAEQVAELVDRAGVNLVGGCCGTSPDHLKAIIEAVGRTEPKKKPAEMIPSISSIYRSVEYRQDASLLNVGERCNASGSRKFKRLLEEENWDEIVSIAREQMREGSHVIDLNVDYAGRDNPADMAHIVSLFVQQVDAPLMLDSTQPGTLEAGLKKAGGKCLINSANLEEGEEKFAELCRLAVRYGSGLVLGTIDEDPEEAMARTADRKLSIAERMHKLATEKYGLREEDLMFDPLVLPVSTGMESDRRSGLETIEGTRRIAERFPKCQITCGLSNISFGLHPAARQVLNSAFLHELSEAGMTSAIVHVSKILPKTKIPDAQWDAAMDLLYDRRDDGDPLQAFIDLFGDDAEVQSTAEEIAALPLEERLQKHIIDGEKRNLTESLDEAMEKYKPLEIINEHLLAGMKVVGELFGSGQMQLPFVLQSAEVMKMAVAHLEPHMEKTDESSKGSMVLATVRGDVHDIGKNLVDILLSNNGFTVYNIGIKQPITDILAEWRKRKADAIGMSGLLVKSVNVMEENLREMVAEGIDVPVLLGGAALSRHYCESHLRSIYSEGGGAVYHGKDAFEGLRIMNMIAESRAEELEAEIDERLTKRAGVDEKLEAIEAKKAEAATAVAAAPRSSVATDVTVPEAPFYGTRVVESVPLKTIYPYVNKIALYRGQWGFKKGRMDAEAYERQLRDEVDPVFENLCRQCEDEEILQPKLVYGYFPANSDGEDLIVYDPEDHDREIERFTFPRQSGKKRLCLSDFFKSTDSGTKDLLPLTCVTVGSVVSERAAALFKDDRYQDYLYMHGMGVECAEALAEFWHKHIRQEMGIDRDDATEIKKLFTQHYRGSRYSFGYPACPEMADQEKLFRLLDPGRIGCVLTDNWQIDPEQSTSAMIVHHPEAKYFSV